MSARERHASRQLVSPSPEHARQPSRSATQGTRQLVVLPSLVGINRLRPLAKADPFSPEEHRRAARIQAILDAGGFPNPSALLFIGRYHALAGAYERSRARSSASLQRDQ
jgi:hypothetical protein